jgi:hypothetical protein
MRFTRANAVRTVGGVALVGAISWSLAGGSAAQIDAGPLVPEVSLPSASPSGFLSAGTHPISVYQDSGASYGQTIYGEGVGSRIQVSAHADGTQTQNYKVTNLDFSWNIAGSLGTVNVNELTIEGLLFRTPGKQWRPLTAAGLTLPSQTGASDLSGV